MVTATTEPVRLPPGPRLPKLVQAIKFLGLLTTRCLPPWPDGTAAK